MHASRSAEAPVESASVKRGSDAVADNEERARATEARNTKYKTRRTPRQLHVVINELLVAQEHNAVSAQATHPREHWWPGKTSANRTVHDPAQE